MFVFVVRNRVSQQRMEWAFARGISSIRLGSIISRFMNPENVLANCIIRALRSLEVEQLIDWCDTVVLRNNPDADVDLRAP